MNKEENRSRGPRRGPNFEKPKNFSEAIKRLLKELNIFKVFIIISLFLASFSAVLSIVSPNKLKNLTDEISKGLVINTKNVEKLSKKIMNNKTYSDIKIDGVTVTFDEQMKFVNTMGKYDKNTKSNKIYKDLDKMPKSIKKVIEPKINLNTIKNISPHSYTFLRY